MKRILVAGAGHGGLAAAIKLAKEGLQVTVIEKNSRNNMGYEQADFLDIDDVTRAGFPVPTEFIQKKIPLSFYAEDENLAPVTQILAEDAYGLCVDRKGFYDYLLNMAEKVGVRTVFDCQIKAPIILGSRIIGVDSSLGRLYADLIIDACGVHSPLREKMPDFTGIQRQPLKYEILHAYRGIYNRIPFAPPPQTAYSIYLRENGTTGFSWLISNHPDEVDVLVGRFPEFQPDEIESCIRQLRKDNPHLGQSLLRGGRVVDIPVRQPLALLVADGYAAVGDSAFMTVPLKGSGLGYCLLAGSMLAQAILDDEDGLYTADSLWKYQRAYFESIGFDQCAMALMKNVLPYTQAESVSELYRQGIVTQEDMNIFANGNPLEGKLLNKLSDFGFGRILEKGKKMIDNSELRRVIFDLTLWLGRFKLIQSTFPEKYDRQEALKWSARYNEFFESIAKKD